MAQVKFQHTKAADNLPSLATDYATDATTICKQKWHCFYAIFNLCVSENLLPDSKTIVWTLNYFTLLQEYSPVHVTWIMSWQFDKYIYISVFESWMAMGTSQTCLYIYCWGEKKCLSLTGGNMMKIKAQWHPLNIV